MTIDPAVEFIDEACGLYFHTIVLPNSGDKVPQHAHDHDHATYVGSGGVVAWAAGECLGEFNAGQAVPIKAGVVHEFQALIPGTRLACVHSIESAESIKRKEG